MTVLLVPLARDMDDDVDDWRWKATDKSYRKLNFLSAQNNHGVMAVKGTRKDWEVASHWLLGSVDS